MQVARFLCQNVSLYD